MKKSASKKMPLSVSMRMQMDDGDDSDDDRTASSCVACLVPFGSHTPPGKALSRSKFMLTKSETSNEFNTRNVNCLSKFHLNSLQGGEDTSDVDQNVENFESFD